MYTKFTTALHGLDSIEPKIVYRLYKGKKPIHIHLSKNIPC